MITERDRNELMTEGWYWSFWCLNDKPGDSPFVTFEKRYGYPPTEALIGKSNLNLNIPDNIKVLGTTTPGHVALR